LKPLFNKFIIEREREEGGKREREKEREREVLCIIKRQCLKFDNDDEDKYNEILELVWLFQTELCKLCLKLFY